LHLEEGCCIVRDNPGWSETMDLPTWLSVIIFSFIVGSLSWVLRRVLFWRGLTKDQIAWAIFASVMVFILMYVALVVLGFA